MTEEELLKDKERMEFPLNYLAETLKDMGVSNVMTLDDPELLLLTIRKLKTLHKIAGTVMNADLLAAVMSE